MKSNLAKCDGINLAIHNTTFISAVDYDNPWQHWELDIVGYDYDNTEHEQDIIGRMSILTLNINEMENNGLTLFDAFDNQSLTLSHSYSDIFTNSGKLRKPFKKHLCDTDIEMSARFHYLEFIGISNQFKGQRLVREATRIYLEHFAHFSDIVYFKGFPLQYGEHEEELEYAEIANARQITDFQTAERALCDYYEKLGFPRIDKTSHFLGNVEQIMVGFEHSSI